VTAPLRDGEPDADARAEPEREGVAQPLVESDGVAEGEPHADSVAVMTLLADREALPQPLARPLRDAEPEGEAQPDGARDGEAHDESEGEGVAVAHAHGDEVSECVALSETVMRGETDGKPEAVSWALLENVPEFDAEREGDAEMERVAVARGVRLGDAVIEGVAVTRGDKLGDADAVIDDDEIIDALALPVARGDGLPLRLPLCEAEAEQVGGFAEPAGHQQLQGVGVVELSMQKKPSGQRIGTTVCWEIGRVRRRASARARRGHVVALTPLKGQ